MFSAQQVQLRSKGGGELFSALNVPVQIRRRLPSKSIQERRAVDTDRAGRIVNTQRWKRGTTGDQDLIAERQRPKPEHEFFVRHVDRNS